MERWRGSVAVVTGAATGIGKETVRLLLENGVKCVGCGRRPEALNTMAGELSGKGELTVIPCDVSKDSDVDILFSEISKKYGGVDICINNAGLGIKAPILTGESKDWQTMFDVNVMGVLRMTKAAVASMKAKQSKESHIININSVMGHATWNKPISHVYMASKQALNAISQGTRFELLADPLNCRISQISPGLVDTPFVPTMHGEEPAQQMLHKFQALEAVDVAQAVIFQLSLPPHVQVQDVIMRGTSQPL